MAVEAKKLKQRVLAASTVLMATWLSCVPLDLAPSQPPTSAIQTSQPSSLSTRLTDLIPTIRKSVVRIETPEGSGTGIIIDSGGLVLTNNHVVGEFTSVTVTLFDRDKVRGTVLGRHYDKDIALIKVDQGTTLPTLPAGDSGNVVSGSDIWAIGYAQGLRGEATVTRGIVSALRTYNQTKYLQIDAAINPGNSGGPLLNANGEVLGINNFRLAESEGIGLALAINEVKPFISGLSKSVNFGTAPASIPAATAKPAAPSTPARTTELFVNKYAGYSIEIPTRHFVNDDNPSMVIIENPDEYPSHQQSDYPTLISYIFYYANVPTDYFGSTLKSYAEKQAQLSRDSSPPEKGYATVTGKEETLPSGLRTYVSSYEQQRPSGLYKNETYTFREGDNAFSVISGYALWKNWSDYEDEFRKMASSFKILPNPAATAKPAAPSNPAPKKTLYTNYYGYQVEVPSNWTVNDDIRSGTSFTVDNWIEFLPTIDYELLEGDRRYGGTLKGFGDEVSRRWASLPLSTATIKLLTTVEYTLPQGLKTLKITLEGVFFQPVGGHARDEKREIFLFRDNNRGFILTGWSEWKNWSKYEKDFHEMVNSFKILPK